jgi:hypothetical protein
VAFLTEYDRRYDAMRGARQFPDGSEPPEDYLVPLWDRHQAVRLVSTEDTARAGERARDALFAYTFRDGDWEAVEYQRDSYLSAVREEFELPPFERPPTPLLGDKR